MGNFQIQNLIFVAPLDASLNGCILKMLKGLGGPYVKMLTSLHIVNFNFGVLPNRD